MAIAVAMGGNTVRATTCGVSVGNSWSIMPRPYVFIDDDSPLWDVYDYAIYAAKQYGLRLLIPLTDNYDYYHVRRTARLACREKLTACTTGWQVYIFERAWHLDGRLWQGLLHKRARDQGLQAIRLPVSRTEANAKR